MCGDHCDRGAIRFRPLGRGRWLPIVEEGGCSGCGDCVGVCPVKAVTMEAVTA
ncbi:4Fe-4S dicluster domain-containing protein [Azospirillum brasilense]|nr:4Fe-4S dicluster domain-containing protein [Azospirillum brasilense]